ncbi:MAG: hypothetical protein ACW99V_02640 [Candidatus Thorarchaeota archaeon]|jgi:hypothetical protein
MSTEMAPKNIIIYILYALAMGVATIVLPLLGQLVNQILVGIVVVCLAITGLDQVDRGL